MEATDLYYNSITSQLIEEGIAGLHCRSDKYFAEELRIEVQKEKQAIQKTITSYMQSLPVFHKKGTHRGIIPYAFSFKKLLPVKA